MALLIYSSKTEEAGGRLLSAIGLLIPENKIEVCQTIDELSQRLRQPLFNPTIAILLATTGEELQNILSIKDLLWDIKIILIVPDMKRGTVAKGHTLRPRFVCDCHSDFVDVAAVLSLMMRNLGHDNNVDIHA